MAKPAPTHAAKRIINKKAHLLYHVLETVEAGIALKGPGVQSLRDGAASLDDAWARVERDGVVLMNFQIDPYRQATTVELAAKRARRLLLRKREIKKLAAKTLITGQTLS